MTKTFDISKAEALSFNVVSEPWCKYVLEDTVILMARLVTTKVYRSIETRDLHGNPMYAWSTQNLFVTRCPTSMKGKPSSPASLAPNQSNYHIMGQVEFKRGGTEDSQWNVYNIEDGSVVRLKLEVINVTKTDCFTQDGDPYYLVESETIPRIRFNPDLVVRPTIIHDNNDDKGMYA